MSRIEQLREQNARLMRATEERSYRRGYWWGFWTATAFAFAGGCLAIGILLLGRG